MLGSRHDNRSRFWSQGHLWHHAQCRNFSTTCHQIQFLTVQTHHPNHTNTTFPYHLALAILLINFSKFSKLKISNFFCKKTLTEPNIKILVYRQNIYIYIYRYRYRYRYIYIYRNRNRYIYIYDNCGSFFCKMEERANLAIRAPRGHNRT